MIYAGAAPAVLGSEGAISRAWEVKDARSMPEESSSVEGGQMPACQMVLEREVLGEQRQLGEARVSRMVHSLAAVGWVNPGVVGMDLERGSLGVSRCMSGTLLSNFGALDDQTFHSYTRICRRQSGSYSPRPLL